MDETWNIFMWHGFCIAFKEEAGEVDGVDEADEVETSAAADVDILNALSGIPLAEDELLYALPVVAPYSTLMPYKLVFLPFWNYSILIVTIWF